MPFSPKTIDFLIENRLHDSREWFESHKKEYRDFVISPLRELVIALTPTMLDIDPKVTTEPKIDRTICRIWRDTRYSKDKSRYRDHMWIIFKRGKMHSTEVPGLYFEISPDGFNYGSGFYHASTDYMNTMRKLIQEGDKDAKQAMAAYQKQSLFLMEGECFKRPRYQSAPEEQKIWLERRNIGFYTESADAQLLFSDQLAEKLSQDFQLLTPIYRFLVKVAQVLHETELQRPSLL
ncbi:MAG: DUF2461 domain-containing protein [Candidatus Pararuminococcus gallinarum]|uniref:TIGR02453 family protein n=1 Tax=Zongyangia sp. HA2173 TaxID=3133035 RepID=UPI00174AFFCD